ncbi:MAG: hypothetical protein BWY71_01992 [Planctomycetes bacterium ADurb.Bin412]|nr:MAG: hypothetical protein BWY71_01992 [Planctomycetes bacterium ADurb.Bin412]
MVIVSAVASIGDNQDELLETFDIEIDGGWFRPAFYDAAVEELFAIAIDLALDAAFFPGLVINAERGGKAGGAALKVDEQETVSVGADAIFIDVACQGERLALDTLIGQRFAPAAGHFGQVKVG